MTYLFLLGVTFLLCITIETSRVPVRTPSNNQNVCHTNEPAIVTSINGVGSRITQQIKGPGNMFFSPLGLSMALGMVYLAAKGKTAEQMEDALGYKYLGIRNKTVHQSYKQLVQNISKTRSNDEYILNIANGLFHQLPLVIPDTYRINVVSFYNSIIHALDFARDPIGAATTINEWAARKTMNKVTNFFTKPAPSDTQILLANAIYFKGIWEIQFPVVKTYEGYFFVDKKDEIMVKMMAISMEKFRYLKDDETGYKFLELPYKGGDVVMLLALPLDFDRSPDLLMTPELLCRLNSSMVFTKLERVAIPKFKLEYEKSFKSLLAAMGLRDAFQPGIADLSGLKRNVHISDIMQKAVIDVNEQGSVAAAVSGVLIVPVSFREVDEFVANHPFSFHIIHKRSGVVLFSGILRKP